jgi:hypothetical protein
VDYFYYGLAILNFFLFKPTVETLLSASYKEANTDHPLFCLEINVDLLLLPLAGLFI